MSSSIKKILIIEPNHQEQDVIIDLLAGQFGNTIELAVTDNLVQAKKLCALTTYSLIILEPECKTYVEGDHFLEWVRSFNSINERSPIIVFTRDLEREKENAIKYNLHPEAKSDNYRKILNPISKHLNTD